MQQGSSVPSSSSSEMQGLHPILQGALDSLDVELEEELTRYRRQKYRQLRLGGHQSTLSWKSPTERSKSTSPSLGLPNFNSSPPHPPAIRPEGSTNDRPPATPQPPALAAMPPAERKSVSQQIDQAANSLESAANMLAWDERPQSVSTSLPLGRAALATIEPDQLPNPLPQANLMRSDASEASDEAPDDYLESSEELLRSIAEETPDLRAERESNLLESLLTPLGIGSMLLLLLSSATLGYVIMHPSSLDLLTAQDAAGETGTDSINQDSASAGAVSIPNTPNLAADEFVDLNLGTLSTVPTSGTSSTGTSSTGSQAAKPSGNNGATANSSTSGQPRQNPDSIVANNGESGTSSSSQPTDPVAVAPSEASNYTAPTYTEPAYTAPAYSEPAYTAPAESEPAASEPSPATNPATAAPNAGDSSSVAAATTSARSGNYYYVVTPYSGDPSLEQAREAVPDAYVRNFSSGASVQLGAFNDPTKAEDLLQQLEEQGISAEIYQPQ